MLDHWVQTVSGRTFRIDRPDARDVDIVDIAHSLALQNRFNGHTRCPYSVGQHSVLVSRIVEQRMGLYPTPDPPCNEPLLGLMHDAHEAYIGDVISPVKKLLGETWRGLENTCDVIIQLGFALKRNPNSLAVVKEADQIALATEVRDLIPGGRIVGGASLPEPLHERIVPLDWLDAKDLFLERFRELTRR